MFGSLDEISSSISVPILRHDVDDSCRVHSEGGRRDVEESARALLRMRRGRTMVLSGPHWRLVLYSGMTVGVQQGEWCRI